jgi:hypothetical protein
MKNNIQLKPVRLLLLVFIVCLFLSGLTAIPIDYELTLLQPFFPNTTWVGYWINEVHAAYNDVSGQHAFLLYGYDWLAFAHIILAILFIGAWRDPVRNIWVIQFGMISCFLVFPFAFVAGSARGIPIGWRLIDCSFGFFGALLLGRVLFMLRNDKSYQNSVSTQITNA